jgi:hypothetical protein
VPAWLAPLRTVMTLASGTAVFLFIASSLLSNITFLATGGAPTSAQEANRDTTAFRADGPAAAQPASTSASGPTPAPSPNALGLARNPTAPPVAQAGDAAASTDDAAKAASERSALGRSDAPGVASAPQERGQFASSEPQRSPLLNPLLWLSLAFLCGAIAIALQRRLRGSV